MIGERLKHAFTGGTAWILSYRDECFDQIGLKATVRIPLLNGALPCELREYEIFDGKYPDFRREGGRLDKREEHRRGEERKPRRFDDRPRRDDRPSYGDRPRRDDRPKRDDRPRYDDRRPRSSESYPERKRREARERREKRGE